MSRLLCLALLSLCSCTFTMTQVSTRGTATDVVDETSSPTADIKATANVTPGVGL